MEGWGRSGGGGGDSGGFSFGQSVVKNKTLRSAHLDHIGSLGYPLSALDFVTDDTVAFRIGRGVKLLDIVGGQTAHHWESEGIRCIAVCRKKGLVATVGPESHPTVRIHRFKGFSSDPSDDPLLTLHELAPCETPAAGGGAKSAFVRSLAFSRDGQRLAVLGDIPGHVLYVYDVDTAALLVAGNGADAFSADVGDDDDEEDSNIRGGDGNRSGNNNSNGGVDGSSSKIRAGGSSSITGHHGTQVSFDPSDRSLLCTCGGGRLSFWKAEDTYDSFALKRVHPLVPPQHDALEFCVATWATKSRVYVGCETGEMVEFDATTGECLTDEAIAIDVDQADDLGGGGETTDAEYRARMDTADEGNLTGIDSSDNDGPRSPRGRRAGDGSNEDKKVSGKSGNSQPGNGESSGGEDSDDDDSGSASSDDDLDADELEAAMDLGDEDLETLLMQAKKNAPGTVGKDRRHERERRRKRAGALGLASNPDRIEEIILTRAHLITVTRGGIVRWFSVVDHSLCWLHALERSVTSVVIDTATFARLVVGHTNGSIAVVDILARVPAFMGDTSADMGDDDDGVLAVTTVGEYHRGRVNAVRGIPQSSAFATAGADGSLRLWDTQTLSALGSYPFGAPLTSLAVNRGGDLIAVGSETGVLRVFAIGAAGDDDNIDQSAMPLSFASRFRLAAGPVRRLAFSSDARWLAAATKGGRLFFLEWLEPSSKTTGGGYAIVGYVEAGSRITGIAWNPSQTRQVFVSLIDGVCLRFTAPELPQGIAVGGEDTRVSADFELDSRACGKSLMRMEFHAYALALLNDAGGEDRYRHFFAMTSDKKVKQYTMLEEAGNPDLIDDDTINPPNMELAAHEKPGGDLAVSERSAWLVSGGADGSLCLRNAASLEEAKIIGRHDPILGGIVSVSFADRDRMVITAGKDGTVFTWRLDDRDQARLNAPDEDPRRRPTEDLPGNHSWPLIKDNTADADELTYLAHLDARAEDELLPGRLREREETAAAVSSLKQSFRDILAHNAKVGELERLDPEELVIDHAAVGAARDAGRAEVAAIRESIGRKIIGMEVVADRIKSEVWDAMDVRGISVRGMGNPANAGSSSGSGADGAAGADASSSGGASGSASAAFAASGGADSSTVICVPNYPLRKLDPSEQRRRSRARAMRAAELAFERRVRLDNEEAERAERAADPAYQQGGQDQRGSGPGQIQPPQSLKDHKESHLEQTQSGASDRRGSDDADNNLNGGSASNLAEGSGSGADRGKSAADGPAAGGGDGNGNNVDDIDADDPEDEPEPTGFDLLYDELALFSTHRKRMQIELLHALIRDIKIEFNTVHEKHVHAKRVEMEKIEAKADRLSEILHELRAHHEVAIREAERDAEIEREQAERRKNKKPDGKGGDDHHHHHHGGGGGGHGAHGPGLARHLPSATHQPSAISLAGGDKGAGPAALKPLPEGACLISGSIFTEKDIFHPRLADDEEPSRVLSVDDSEVKVEKVLTAEEREAEERKRIADELALLNKKRDDSAERALRMMMGGRLVHDKEKELEEELEMPAWMRATDPEDMSEEQLRAFQEFKTEAATRREEREKRRKALETEHKKITGTVASICEQFDQSLRELDESKREVDGRVYECELRIINLSRQLLKEENDEAAESLLLKDLELRKAEKRKTASALTEFKREVDRFRETYENLVLDDKAMDKAFRRDFQDQGEHFDILLRLYKRRAKASKHNSANNANSANSANSATGSDEDHPDPFAQADRANLEADPVEDRLDPNSDWPESISEPVWDRLVSARAVKISSESEIRRQAATLQDMTAHLNRLAAEDDRARVNIERIMARLSEFRDDRAKMAANLEKLFRLKQGQVEVEQEAVVTDYADAVMVNKSVVSELNRRIAELGKEKLEVLHQVRDQRRAIHMLKWENKKLGMEAEDCMEKMRDFQLLRVTKALQELIKGGGKNKHAAEIAMLEKKSEHSKKTHEEKVRGKRAALGKIRLQIRDKDADNRKLDAHISSLEISVAERNNIYELQTQTTGETGDAKRKRFNDIVKQKKLFDLAKAQTEEIEFLRAELFRLRSRVFPSFANNQDANFNPDENR